jgi:cell wall-associated NlpC family hydrolase
MPQSQDQSLISQDEPGSMRSRLVEAGFQMIGVRYRRSGGSEKTGFDCSGLVKSLFSKFNIDLPRSSREQYKQGEKVDRDKLEVGDLVFFSSGGTRPTHVGIYIGNDRFLHAARKARQVMVSDLGKLWYTMRYLGARRIADLWGEEPESNSEKQQ